MTGLKNKTSGGKEHGCCTAMATACPAETELPLLLMLDRGGERTLLIGIPLFAFAFSLLHLAN